MKFVFLKIREWLGWLFDNRVLDAINNGKTYDEVEAIAKGMK